MAAGRRHYALETLAHRDGYTIKDNDNCDGVAVGSRPWAEEGCPSVLDAAWHGPDVLARWRHELRSASNAAATTVMGIQDEINTATPSPLHPPPDVRLSSDAGRFVCDFLYYESLSLRWKEERERLALLASASASPPPRSSDQYIIPTASDSPQTSQLPPLDPSTSKLGKVAFLHVPGDTDAAAIERGVRVTVAAIRALVASWEAGLRREGGVQVPSPERKNRGVGVRFVG